MKDIEMKKATEVNEEAKKLEVGLGEMEKLMRSTKDYMEKMGISSSSDNIFTNRSSMVINKIIDGLSSELDTRIDDHVLWRQLISDSYKKICLDLKIERVSDDPNCNMNEVTFTRFKKRYRFVMPTTKACSSYLSVTDMVELIKSLSDIHTEYKEIKLLTNIKHNYIEYTIEGKDDGSTVTMHKINDELICANAVAIELFNNEYGVRVSDRVLELIFSDVIYSFGLHPFVEVDSRKTSEIIASRAAMCTITVDCTRDGKEHIIDRPLSASEFQCLNQHSVMHSIEFARRMIINGNFIIHKDGSYRFDLSMTADIDDYEELTKDESALAHSILTGYIINKGGPRGYKESDLSRGVGLLRITVDESTVSHITRPSNIVIETIWGAINDMVEAYPSLTDIEDIGYNYSVPDIQHPRSSTDGTYKFSTDDIRLGSIMMSEASRVLMLFVKILRKGDRNRFFMKMAYIPMNVDTDGDVLPPTGNKVVPIHDIQIAYMGNFPLKHELRFREYDKDKLNVDKFAITENKLKITSPIMYSQFIIDNIKVMSRFGHNIDKETAIHYLNSILKSVPMLKYAHASSTSHNDDIAQNTAFMDTLNTILKKAVKSEMVSFIKERTGGNMPVQLIEKTVVGITMMSQFHVVDLKRDADHTMVRIVNSGYLDKEEHRIAYSILISNEAQSNYNLVSTADYISIFSDNIFGSGETHPEYIVIKENEYTLHKIDTTAFDFGLVN